MMYFEMLYISRSLFNKVKYCNGKISDIDALPAYLEYRALLAEGNKKEYIFAVIKDKYNIGKCAMLSLAARMEIIV